MKKAMSRKVLLITLVILSILLVSVGAYYSFYLPSIEKQKNKEVLGSERESAFKEMTKPVYKEPYKLKIESVGIEAHIVPLGVLPDGTLDAPKNWMELGWYEDGSKSGEPGNFIIDGHYDTNTGSPAIFYTLKNIQLGDIVTVIDKSGRTFDYKVNEKFYIHIDDPNRLQIFENKTDTAHITLITCGGIWLNNTYSQRLVVKGDIINEVQ